MEYKIIYNKPIELIEIEEFLNKTINEINFKFQLEIEKIENSPMPTDLKKYNMEKLDVERKIRLEPYYNELYKLNSTIPISCAITER